MIEGRGHSETARQLVHVSMGAFALLLRWLTWWQALALAGGALLFNLFVLPSIGGQLYRPGDDPRRLHGILFYPLSVLMLLICFPRRLDLAAGAWGILAAGDGLATLVGRLVNGTTWPWNRDKTLAGSAAFVVAGGAAAAGLLWWCRPSHIPAAPGLIVGMAVAAALAAAAVETIPVRLDDNLSVALTAGAVLWLGSLVDVARLEPAWIAVAPTLPIAVAVNAAISFAGHRARTVSSSGAIAGAIIGTIIFAMLGWRGWLMLFATFVSASVSSRLGLHRKMLLGIAEERGGRRGAGNAIANTGVAAICAVLTLLTPFAGAARMAFVTALAAAGSDTIASEIGKGWGRRTWSVTSLSQVPPGTSGAMSVEGTLAGLIAAVALGLVGSLLGLIPLRGILIAAVAATIGSLLESWLGATLEGPGVLNNDMLNFINTAAAGFAAVLFIA
jgi:uncharacterized protein (TIGR00297 family)